MELALREDKETIAHICLMLENETRLEILIALAQEDLSLDELYREHGLSQHRSGLHRHLQQLREAGIIEKYLNQQTDEKTYRLVEERIEIELSED